MSEPWEDAGFSSFAEYDTSMKQQSTEFKTKAENLEKLVGRQGNELGVMKQALEKLGAKIEEKKEGETRKVEIIMPTQPTAEEKKVEEKIDYPTQVDALLGTLPDAHKQLLEQHFKTVTPEQLAASGIKSKKELVNNPEVRYHYIKSFIETVGEPEPESFFTTPTRPQQSLGLEDRVKILFNQFKSKPSSPAANRGGSAIRTGHVPGGEAVDNSLIEGRVKPIGGDLFGGLKMNQQQS